MRDRPAHEVGGGGAQRRALFVRQAPERPRVREQRSELRVEVDVRRLDVRLACTERRERGGRIASRPDRRDCISRDGAERLERGIRRFRFRQEELHAGEVGGRRVAPHPRRMEERAGDEGEAGDAVRVERVEEAYSERAAGDRVGNAGAGDGERDRERAESGGAEPAPAPRRGPPELERAVANRLRDAPLLVGRRVLGGGEAHTKPPAREVAHALPEVLEQRDVRVIVDPTDEHEPYDDGGATAAGLVGRADARARRSAAGRGCNGRSNGDEHERNADKAAHDVTIRGGPRRRIVGRPPIRRPVAYGSPQADNLDMDGYNRIARRGVATLAVPALAGAYATAVVAATDVAVDPPTTYAAVSLTAHAADVAAGVALLVAGVAAWLEPRTGRLGALAVLAAAAWFLPDWEGWSGGPALARSVAAALAPLLLVVVLHLVTALPRGRIPSRPALAVVAAAYALAGVVGVGRATLGDPLLEGSCWRYCVGNPLLVHRAQGVAEALDKLGLWTALAVAVVLAATSWRRLGIASAAARRRLAPVLAPAVAVAAADAAYAIALLRTPLEDPRTKVFATIFVLRSLALFALGAGLAYTVVRARRVDAAIAHLGRALGEAPPPGRLAETLARATGDPTLDVAYWLPDEQRYVGPDGHPPTEFATGGGRAVTQVTRSGRPVAAVAHDAALVEWSPLDLELAPAVRLALENERLQAEALAQLHGLRESRARVVEARDDERRRLERDLHDGAQQRLLALSYDLRLAHAAADANSDLAAILAAAQEEAHGAIADLRELAHGIFPAILAEAGLARALTTLAESAPLAVELEEITAARHPDAVETAAYLTVAEAIADADARGGSVVTARVGARDGRLVVELADDGAPRRSDLVHLADRIGALGGSIELDARTLRAEIPCA